MAVAEAVTVTVAETEAVAETETEAVTVTVAETETEAVTVAETEAVGIVLVKQIQALTPHHHHTKGPGCAVPYDEPDRPRGPF